MPDDYVNNLFSPNPNKDNENLVKGSQQEGQNNQDSDTNIWGQNHKEKEDFFDGLREDNVNYEEDEEDEEKIDPRDFEEEEDFVENKNIQEGETANLGARGTMSAEGEATIGAEAAAAGETAAIAGEAAVAGEVAAGAVGATVATSEIWIPIIIIAILLFILFFALIGFKKLGSTNTSGDGSSGGIITEPVNGTREELVDQILTMSNAGDIVVDPDSLANIKSDDLNINLLKLIVTLAKEIKNHGGALEINCLMCAHNNDSFHNYGLAIDIDHSNTANYLMPWLNIPENIEILKINELIFNSTCSPISAVGEGAGNKYNLDEGAPFAYDDTTLSGHCDHIHIAVYSD